MTRLMAANRSVSAKISASDCTNRLPSSSLRQFSTSAPADAGVVSR
jgi:hypothetical protein